MERLKKALDMAREARDSQQGPATPGRATRNAGPRIDLENVRTVDASAVKRDIRIIAGQASNPVADAYRMLRTRVRQRLAENNWRVLGITSPGAGEGKTLTSVNLAISLAREVDQTVVLVDMDLRRPSVHQYFDFEPELGLNDVLDGQAEIRDTLVSTGIERLLVLPGRLPLTNSSEMAGSPLMTEIVAGLKAMHPDLIVVFDLPPLLAFDDTLAFSANLDAVLMVVEEGKTRDTDILRAQEMLDEIPVIGTVLNKAEADSATYDYYHSTQNALPAP